MTDTAQPPLFVCPFCGGKTPDQPRCASCNGPLDPLSRQATQNSMGPWFIRDEQQPFRPGCSYDTVVALIARGKITLDTILRGPTTAQFWYPARRVPGVAHRFGVCHSCQAELAGDIGTNCPDCGAELLAEPDRQFLGLMPVRHIPGQGPAQAPQGPSGAHSQTVGENNNLDPSVREVTIPPEMHARPAFQTPLEPRRRAVEGRLEGEIQALRQRTTVLICIAIGCVLIAMIAIAITLQSRKSSVASVAGQQPGSSSPQSAAGAGSAPSGTGSVTRSPVAPRQQPTGIENADATGKNADEKPADPVEPANPSPELDTLRQTRWP